MTTESINKIKKFKKGKMTIKFDIFESPVVDKEATHLPHPKVLTSGVVDTKKLSERISCKCTASPADVNAVITALSEEMAVALKNSCSVHIGGLGFFRLILKYVPGSNSKRIAAADIRLKAVKFMPDKEFKERFQTLEVKRVKASARHSSKLSQPEVLAAVAGFFKKNSFMRRTDMEAITGFNTVKALRTIRWLLDEGRLKNLGSRYQPLYVKGEAW